MAIDYKNYHRDRQYRKDERLFRNIFQNRFNLIRPSLVEVSRGRILDIGCSNAIFLDLYRESGWETWGVEPSENASVARVKGHKIIKSVFEKADLPKDYFDLVVLNHTLEHLDNPMKILKKVYGLLKRGGILFVDVPNAGGLGAKILGDRWPYRLPDEHKWQFTRLSLSKIVKKAGFKILTFKSRSGIFEYANPLLELSRPRFLLDLIMIPYSLIATLLNIGDSMSIIARADT